MIARTELTQKIFVAVVLGRDGVRFTAAAPTRAALAARIGGYARRQARHQLWSPESEHVLRLLDDGKIEAAIEMYFGLVGSRWDEEWLVTTCVAATPDWTGEADASVGAIVGAPEEWPRAHARFRYQS